MTNLAARIGTGVVVLPLLVAAFFWGPRWLGPAIVSAACVVALHEFYALMRARGLTPLATTGVVTLALVFLEVARPGVWPPLLPLALVLLVGASLARARALAESLPAAALTFFGSAYLGALGGGMTALLLLEPAVQGPWRMVFLMAVIMTADTGAFFAGRMWGRRKLAPLVSPGKTVEGVVGALVTGVPPALLVRAYGFPAMPAWHAVGLGLLVSVAGIVGDLGESLMKRWAGVKDSGVLFPGHGGMLDRLDSLLFGAAVLYYYFLIVH